MFVPKHPKRLLLHAIITVVPFLLLCSHAQADPVVIDFEGPGDSTPITTQYPGITFANATILTSGISLNEFELPPHSGTNVIFDDGGAITINFASAVDGVGGYFTYTTQLTITAFDSANNVLGSLTSGFNNNLGLSGDLGSSPNEFLTFSFLPGISRLLIQGDSLGGSFVLDDLTYHASAEAVPEPGSWLLLVSGLTTFVVSTNRRRH
jgi:hypothetical protein